MPKVVDVARIYRATLQVFVERGYGAATTRDIAQRAGVNEATLYRRFSTKAELVRSALAHELGESPFGRLRGSDDARADIAMIARAYVETFDQFGAVVMALLCEAARHPEIDGAAAALLPNLRNAAGIIAAHQAAGRIAPGDPLLKLVALIAPLAMLGIATDPVRRLITDAGQPDPDRIAADFLHGHAARPDRQ